MTARRKTIEVDNVKQWANMQLSRKETEFYQHVNDPEWVNGFYDGISTLLEHILHDTGNYHGFNFVAWARENGCENWYKDGQPSDNTPYLGNQHRKVYY